MVVSNERLASLQRTYLDGPADLVVEVISPESVTRDRVTKFKEYERGGVRDYWILDPDNRQPEFFHRGDTGRFAPIPVGTDGVFRSLMLRPPSGGQPGFWLRVEWLWEPPPYLEVLRAWGLIQV